MLEIKKAWTDALVSKATSQIFDIKNSILSKQHKMKNGIRVVVYETCIYEGSKFYSWSIRGLDIGHAVYSYNTAIYDAQIQVLLQIMNCIIASDNMNKIVTICFPSGYLTRWYRKLVTDIDGPGTNKYLIDRVVEKIKILSERRIIITIQTKVPKSGNDKLLLSHIEYMKSYNLKIIFLKPPKTYRDLQDALRMRDLIDEEVIAWSKKLTV